MFRKRVRTAFFGFLQRVSATEDAGEIFSNLLRHPTGGVAFSEFDLAGLDSAPYADVAPGGRAQIGAVELFENRSVFVTGRFRSGSTLMWNIFRHVPGVTSYYEPFNERRWFDLAGRGEKVDQTHLGISNYWSEYDNLSELGQYFSPEWKFRNLYMSGSAYDASMQRYIETMILRASGKSVLQFNEVDFRLGWLRAWFPRVPIIHIFRHPRDQWCSTLQEAAQTAARCKIRDFAQYDGFYLLSWARDLSHVFPFLSLEPDAFAYELYYQVWKLSYLFGRRYSELSVKLEDLISDPGAMIRRILDVAGMREVDAEPLLPLVSPVRTCKWRECADADWFSEIESRVDHAVARYAVAVNADKLLRSTV